MKRTKLSGLVALLALLATLTGATVWVVQTNSGTRIEIQEPDATPISVEISGEVKNPGVYELRDGDRVSALILAAGGVDVCGDASQLNQAAMLIDGTKITVSTLVININTADLEALQKLPGIGPALADRIVAARPFESLDDLDRVTGIGTGKIADIKSGSCKATS